MYTEVLRSMSDIHLFPTISLVLFVFVFGAVIVQVLCMDAERIAGLAALPLDDGRAAGRAPGDREGRSR